MWFVLFSMFFSCYRGRLFIRVFFDFVVFLDGGALKI